MYVRLLGLSRSKTECVFGLLELILLGLVNKNCRYNIKIIRSNFGENIFKLIVVSISNGPTCWSNHALPAQLR